MVSHSPVCFKAIVFVATSISVLVLPGVNIVQGIQKVEWL